MFLIDLGAYGGNKTLMALLQILASKAAKVDTLVYHTFMNIFTEKYIEATKILDKLLPDDKPVKTEYILKKIQEMKFKWGVSDGN